MRAKKVNVENKTWRIENEFVYYYLLEGEESALLIDSGAFDEDVKAVAESLTKLPVTLVNTHGDGDHVAGNKYFNSYYIHPEDYKRCGMIDKCSDSRQLDLKGGQEFNLGNRILKVVEIPGHTYGSVAFLDVTNRIVFPGDTISDAIIFLFGKHRCPDNYKKALETLISLENEYDYIYPCHGTPILKSGYGRKVLEDWEKVLSGKASCTKENVHGVMVDTYKLECCGFYYEGDTK